MPRNRASAKKAGPQFERDVADYLASHAIRARTLLRDARHATVTDELLSVVAKEQVDLVIVGPEADTIASDIEDLL